MNFVGAALRTLRKHVFHRLGLGVVRKSRALLRRPHLELRADLELMALHLAQRQAEVFFVLVGAHDGELEERFLPMAINYGWSGVLVEPQQDAFARLAKRMESVPNVVCRNVAIDWVAGERVLYRIREGSEVPTWAMGIASFRRDHVLKFRSSIPEIEALIVEDLVECVTFPELLREAGEPTLDVLQVDAEGFDFQILQMADLPNRRPKLVNFEHIHLSSHDWEEATKLLLDLGYQVTNSGPDTIAYRFGP